VLTGEGRAPLNRERVEALLTPDHSWPIPDLLGSVGSTNDVIAERAAAGAPEGTCVVAEEQVAGRGRRGRTWVSPPGSGLWVSVLVRAADRPVEARGLLPLLAGMAARTALLADYLRALSALIRRWHAGDPSLLEEYREVCLSIGRTVEAHLPDGSVLVGSASGVDEEGHLLVASAGTTRVVTAGDVVHATI